MIKKKKCLLRPLIYFIIICLLIISACGEKSNPVLRFTVMGDIHYQTPDFRSSVYLVPPVAGELSALEPIPEFIIQTGDFFHGSRGADAAAEALFSFKNFTENMDVPFFIAKGNHDTREYYEKNALPLFSRELETEIIRPY